MVNLSKSNWINWKKESKKKSIGETRDLTLNLFNCGKSIKQIAKIREFKEQTIQYHIIELITQGILNINKIIDLEKQKNIKFKINKNTIKSLSLIKNQLPKNYSYFEIKCVLAEIASKPEK